MSDEIDEKREYNAGIVTTLCNSFQTIIVNIIMQIFK